MSQEVTVRITKNYGCEAIYPTNEQGQIFADLIGKKTFSRYDIKQIQKLGYAIKVEAPVL